MSVLKADVCVVLATLLMAGCAGQQTFTEGRAAMGSGDVAGGLAKLREATKLEPNNAEYRKEFVVQRERVLLAARRNAEALMEAGDFAGAEKLIEQFEKVAEDGGSGNGHEKLKALIERRKDAWARLERAEAQAASGKLDLAIQQVQELVGEGAGPKRAQAVLRRLLRERAQAGSQDVSGVARLRAEYRKPVSMTFTDASLKQVLDALKAASGLNYIFDREVQAGGRVTMSVDKKPLEDVVAVVLASNQMASRVIDEDTVLVYPATAQKVSEYKELAVRVFNVSNGDATKIAAVVKQVTKAKDVQVDERLGMIIIRDTPELIRVAEKVIAAADLIEPEVMLELEVIEINKSRLIDAGVQWPTGISAGVTGAAGVPGSLTLDELRNPSKSMLNFAVGDPLVSAKLKSTAGAATILANPRIRVRSRTMAKVLIGDKVPVVTVTQNSLGGSSESVNYLDVGLKLEIKPTVSLDDDVTMELNLEVSNIVETVVRSSGTQTYRIGTRNTNTSLRVADGETSVLGGLIRNEDRRSNAGIPYVNEAPVVGKLFGMGSDSDQQTEIVLMVTPRVIRTVDVPTKGIQEYGVGTEGVVGGKALTMSPAAVASGTARTITVTGGESRASDGGAPRQAQQLEPPATVATTPPPAAPRAAAQEAPRPPSPYNMVPPKPGQ